MNPQQMQQLQQAQMMASQLQAGQQMQAAQMGGNPMMAQQQQAMMAQQQQAAMAQQQQAMMAQQQQAAMMGGMGGGMGGMPQQQAMMGGQMGGMGGMGGMPAAQPTMGQPVQASPMMGAPMGATAGSSKVTLPDGSVVTKEALSIIFSGPSGQTMSISPVPQWKVGAGGASGGGKMITEKAAVCLKMSNQKMPVTGFTRWQERHITLNALRLSWATSAGGAERNHIDIDASFNIYKAESDSPRYKDAYRKEDQTSMTSMLTQPIGNMLSETTGTVGKDFVLAIRKPTKPMDMLDNVMGTLNESSAIGLAFGGGAKKLQKGMDENTSRTYYFAFASAAERDDFHDAIVNNLNAYMGTPAFMEDVQAPFKNGLRRVGANVDAIDLCPFLDELYSQ